MWRSLVMTCSLFFGITVCVVARLEIESERRFIERIVGDRDSGFMDGTLVTPGVWEPRLESSFMTYFSPALNKEQRERVLVRYGTCPKIPSMDMVQYFLYMIDYLKLRPLNNVQLSIALLQEMIMYAGSLIWTPAAALSMESNRYNYYYLGNGTLFREDVAGDAFTMSHRNSLLLHGFYKHGWRVMCFVPTVCRIVWKQELGPQVDYLISRKEQNNKKGISITKGQAITSAVLLKLLEADGPYKYVSQYELLLLDPFETKRKVRKRLAYMLDKGKSETYDTAMLNKITMLPLRSIYTNSLRNGLRINIDSCIVLKCDHALKFSIRTVRQ